MESHEIHSFISTIAESMDDVHVDGKPTLNPEQARELAALEFEARGLTYLVDIVETDGFKGWLDARSDGDARTFKVLVNSNTCDPYQRGRSDGRMSLILELRSSRESMLARLKSIQARIQIINRKVQ